MISDKCQTVLDTLQGEGWGYVCEFLRELHFQDLKRQNGSDVLSPAGQSNFLISKGEAKRTELLMSDGFADQVRKFYENGK